jgi:hypothetical protein
MIRRALLISGETTIVPGFKDLPGTLVDLHNYKVFLESNLGGNWDPTEIHTLNSPYLQDIKDEVNDFLNGADYTFVVFSGHGGTNRLHNNLVYLTLFNEQVPLTVLRSNAPRQAMLIDACRDYDDIEPIMRRTNMLLEARNFSTGPSTRGLFESAVKECSEGIIPLYASKENESAGCDSRGSFYLNSLIAVARRWANQNRTNTKFPLDEAHDLTYAYMIDNYVSGQHPEIEAGKRRLHFPFAVKFPFMNL